ncbi:hypothetical protein M3Y99_01813300 [Aphelenchoides fujianensis]|nr:hypothetical protein M3Y99_01813300 [Aphelenchoides fujianensis]
MIVEDHEAERLDPTDADHSDVDDEQPPEFRSVEEFADHLAAASFHAGIREWRALLGRSIQKKRRKILGVSLRTMAELSLVAVVAVLVALFRYSDLVESKLAVRAAAQPRRFFPRDAHVFDYFRGDGASYAELYNQADPHDPHVLRALESPLDGGPPALRFVAVNCDVGQCKRTLKLYYYPVFVALTNANVALIYEDSPTFELLFRQTE